MTAPYLFASPPYLEQKLGSKIFDSVPNKPGIYRFYNSNGELIYVGKAKNLRQRLFSYKRVRPGIHSRKLSSLISKITSFEFDVLKSEHDAFLQENRWIREHRPEFNHANKTPETYYFIRTGSTENTLHFRLSMNQKTGIKTEKIKPLFLEEFKLSQDMESKIYGCFKGHNLVRSASGALLQLLWMAENRIDSIQHLPVQLTRNLTPLQFTLHLNSGSILIQSEVKHLLHRWLSGESNDLCDILYQLNRHDKNRFISAFVEDRIEIMTSFYSKKLHHNFKIRQRFQGRQIIQQDELDDLTVLISDDKCT